MCPSASGTSARTSCALFLSVAAVIIYLTDRSRSVFIDATGRFKNSLCGRFLRACCWRLGFRYALHERLKPLGSGSPFTGILRQSRKRFLACLCLFHKAFACLIAVSLLFGCAAG